MRYSVGFSLLSFWAQPFLDANLAGLPMGSIRRAIYQSATPPGDAGNDPKATFDRPQHDILHSVTITPVLAAQSNASLSQQSHGERDTCFHRYHSETRSHLSTTVDCSP